MKYNIDDFVVVKKADSICWAPCTDKYINMIGRIAHVFRNNYGDGYMYSLRFGYNRKPELIGFTQDMFSPIRGAVYGRQ